MSDLAPLQRKNHTIAIGILDGQPYLFMFGGLSLERDSLSNGMFMVAMSDVANGRATWRSATSSGSSPFARQHHVFITIANDTILLHGGLGADDRPLSDVAILCTSTLVWTMPNTAGIPSPAIFQHSATIASTATGQPCILVFGGALILSNTNRGLIHSNTLYTLELRRHGHALLS